MSTNANADPALVTTETDLTCQDFGILSLRPSKFGGEDRYSGRFWAKKGSKTAAAWAAAEKLVAAERFGTKLPSNFRSSILDGDALDANGERKFPEAFKGMTGITAKSSRPVTCWIGAERRAPTEADIDNGLNGAQVCVSAKAFAYSREASGVSWGLNIVWKTGPGIKLGTAGNAEADMLKQAGQVTWSDDANVAAAPAAVADMFS